MTQRRSVTPPPWDEVAERLTEATGGKIHVRGQMLRRWVVAAEAERTKEAAK